MMDHLVPVDHINLEAIDHLARVITDHPGVDRRCIPISTAPCPFSGLHLQRVL
jgi:hypothetical protein